jgi:hypothetical protein
MHRLIRVLTAATLAVHLMVGCCAHHAHACDGAVHSPAAQATATVDGQCAHSSDGGADHTNHGPQNCQEGKCLCVASISSSGNTVAQSSLASVTPLLDGQDSRIATDSERHFSTAGWHPLPVRLHLANQVMLI